MGLGRIRPDGRWFRRVSPRSSPSAGVVSGLVLHTLSPVNRCHLLLGGSGRAVRGSVGLERPGDTQPALRCAAFPAVASQSQEGLDGARRWSIARCSVRGRPRDQASGAMVGHAPGRCLPTLQALRYRYLARLGHGLGHGRASCILEPSGPHYHASYFTRQISLVCCDVAHLRGSLIQRAIRLAAGPCRGGLRFRRRATIH